MLSSLVGRIQRRVSVLTVRRHGGDLKVPEDVKNGYFAVITKGGEDTKRFVLELDFLSDPAFMGLLDRAQEEYGFAQKGALAVPCTPQELEKIVVHKRRSFDINHY